MTWDRFTSIGVLDVVAAALSLPLISLTIALVIAVGILATKRAGADHRPSSAPFEAPGRSVASRYEPEHRVLGVAAVAVIVLFATENVVRGYLLNLADVVSWWRFATPLPEQIGLVQQPTRLRSPNLRPRPERAYCYD